MKFTRETLHRALRTFLQAAAAYVAANLLVVDFTAESDVLTSALFGLLVSAFAAGIAAVMNLERFPVEKTEETEEPEEDEAPEEEDEVSEYPEEPVVEEELEECQECMFDWLENEPESAE